MQQPSFSTFPVQPRSAPDIERVELQSEARMMLVELAVDFAVPGSAVYVLGLGGASRLLRALHADLDRRVRLNPVGTDAQALHAIRQDLRHAMHQRSSDLQQAGLDGALTLHDASVAILVGTARTVPSLHRSSLVAEVHRGLRAGGCALVVEAIRNRDSLLNNLFAAHAHARGRVEVPEAMQMAGLIEEEIQLLKGAGFRSVDVFYRWYGSCGLIAMK